MSNENKKNVHPFPWPENSVSFFRRHQTLLPMRSRDDRGVYDLAPRHSKVDDREEEEEEALLNELEAQDAPMSYRSPKSRYCCGGTRYSRLSMPRRRSCCGRCIIVSFILFIAFIIFCAFYFSPASLPAPTVPDKSTNTNAKFLTLNIFMRPPGVKNNRSDYKEARLNYIIENILPNYDVVAVQEAFAFANRRIDKLRLKARQLGFNYELYSPRHYPWQLAADGGLLLLSRFPIAQGDVIEYPRGVHADWMSYKGALHALIQLNTKRTIHVYTSHTQASYDASGALNQQDTRVRLSQFARLHEFISDTARDDGSPILIMGDLNIDASAHEGAKTDKAVANSTAYTMMMDVLRGTGIRLDDEQQYMHPWHIDTLVDAAYQQFGYHPVTFGDVRQLPNGTIVPAETVLTHWDQLMTVQSIDRILWADRFSTDLKLSNITVEKFLVKDQPFTQISGKKGN